MARSVLFTRSRLIWCGFENHNVLLRENFIMKNTMVLNPVSGNSTVQQPGSRRYTSFIPSSNWALVSCRHSAKHIQELSFCASMLITFHASHSDAKCMVVTHVCVCALVSVRGCMPTLLHGSEFKWENGGGAPQLCTIGQICDRSTSSFQTIVRSGSIFV